MALKLGSILGIGALLAGTYLFFKGNDSNVVRKDYSIQGCVYNIERKEDICTYNIVSKCNEKNIIKKISFDVSSDYCNSSNKVGKTIEAKITNLTPDKFKSAENDYEIRDGAILYHGKINLK